MAPSVPAAPGVALLRTAVARRVFPAAVAEVGASAGPIWSCALGTLTFDLDAAPVTPGTVFDLASLTKPIATTSVALDLAASGRLPLDTPVARHAPEWLGADREPVTIVDLLEHASGLSARLLDAAPGGGREFEHEICTMPLEYPPRSASVYSDLGFILLGFCAERAGGAPLADQTTRIIDATLSATAAGSDAWLGPSTPDMLRAAVAPTRPLAEDIRRGRRLVGEVHDNYAAALGGFAGHAGLFGTASGVGAFARGVLRAARGDTTLPQPLSPPLVTRAITRSRVPRSSRALGWDTMLPTSSCGTRLSAAAFGHVGFTGTSLWIDPPRDRYYVLLTNRVSDGGTIGDMLEVRRAFHDTLADL